MLTDQLLVIRDGKCAGHGNYYDLISQQTTRELLSDSGLTNSIEMRVEKIDAGSGIMKLDGAGNNVIAETWSDPNVSLRENEAISVFLRPEDITLALHQIDDISMQNQLKGTIEKLIVSDNKVLCVIDHGFKLIAEVTIATRKRMKLKEGAEIWSLFKAAAIKMNSDKAFHSSI